MKTTSLFVELIVIGIGTILGILLIASGFGIVTEKEMLALGQLSDAALLALGLAITYVLGIVTDRFADKLFSKSSARIRANYYEERSDVLVDRVHIYEETSPLVDMIDYGRSRMRICRGWMLSSLLIFLGSNLYFFLQLSDSDIKSVILIDVLLVILFISLYSAWKNLTEKEFSKLKDVSNALRKQKAKQ